MTTQPPRSQARLKNSKEWGRLRNMVNDLEKVTFSEKESRLSKKPGDENAAMEIAELRDFPESVRSLFEKLPDPMKKQLLDKIERDEAASSPEEDERSLEEVVSSLGTEKREEFTSHCLNELFENAKLKKRFHADEGKHLKQDIARLLGTLWQNRGKRDDVELFNREYYDNFFRDREVIAAKIREKNAQIRNQEASILTTHKQKNLTARKKDARKRFTKEEDSLVEELKAFDKEHGNSSMDSAHSQDIASRERKEKEWTKAVAIVSEYLDPTEFATVVAEQLERTFYTEFSIARDPERTRFGRPVPEHEVERARNIVDAVTQVIEGWNQANENDHSLKRPVDEKMEKRRFTLINYTASLMGSYQRSKKDGRNDEEMIYTIRQTEIALKFLQK